MFEINTNLSVMQTANSIRLNQLDFTERLERLSSGSRINHSSDDPSGLAISTGMQAQLRGINEAMGNAQDTTYLLQLTDDFLSNIWDRLNRMHELSVRLANEAPLSNQPGSNAADLRVHDMMELHKEIQMNFDDIVMSFATHESVAPFTPFNADHVPRLNYNHKAIFSNFFTPDFSSPGGAIAQIGPDNTASHQVGIYIDDLYAILPAFVTPYTPPPPAGDATSDWYRGYAQNMMDKTTGLMDQISDTRSSLGSQFRRMNSAINDLKAEYIGISGAKSTIQDADFAKEATDLARTQIISQTTSITFSEANAMPRMISSLLDVIYGGINEKMVGDTTIKPVGG